MENMKAKNESIKGTFPIAEYAGEAHMTWAQNLDPTQILSFALAHGCSKWNKTLLAGQFHRPVIYSQEASWTATVSSSTGCG